MTTSYDQLSKRALLTLILERQDQMQISVESLTQQVALLTSAVGALKPALDANDSVTTASIAALENFSQQLATMPATQAAIDGLASQVSSQLSSLQADAAEAAATTARAQAELDKLTPPTTPPAA